MAFVSFTIKASCHFVRPDSFYSQFSPEPSSAVQQAAYDMLTDDEKRQQHMEIGLALYLHSMAISNIDDRLFFTAVSQINKGGPESVYDANQKEGAFGYSLFKLHDGLCANDIPNSHRHNELRSRSAFPTESRYKESPPTVSAWYCVVG